MKSFYVYTTAGFGNVLFMLMNGYALARKYKGALYAVISSQPASRPHVTQYHLFRRFEFQDPSPAKGPFRVYQEPQFKFAEPAVGTIGDNQNYVLNGYFQSWKYSSEQDIQDLKDVMLEGSPVIQTWREEFAEVLRKSGKKKTLLVHVRRTDYITSHACHPVQPQAYYEKALEELYTDDHLIIASSDDAPYLKQWDLLKKYPHYIVEEGIEKTWTWMTMCDDYIIANSSMSLSAYYFRDIREAKLRAPSTWFGPKGPSFDIEEIVKVTTPATEQPGGLQEQSKIIYINPYDYPAPQSI